VPVLTGTTEKQLADGRPFKNVWIVAEASYLVFFDPQQQTYGLADRRPNVSAPVFVGVDGDLVGVFGAM
jgi:hypothetical protein